jgi:hypothetical protein
VAYVYPAPEERVCSAWVGECHEKSEQCHWL